MYITQLHFDKILEWFHHSQYEFLLLFLPSGNPGERRFDDYIIENQFRINKLTGKSITYIEYTKWNIGEGDTDTADNPVSINTRQLSKREIRTHINISYEVCDKFCIEQYKLPALIMISKDDTYNLYPISTEDDFDTYFTLINTVTSFQKDYINIYEVERNISRLTQSPYESTDKEKILSIYGEKINESICIPNGKEILQAILMNYSSGLIELLNMVKNRIPEKINNKNIHKVFIAGSTTLDTERDGIRSILSLVSKKSDIDFQTWTFEEFERSFCPQGRQNDYNSFIREEADSIVFIINDCVGDETYKEFKIAVESYLLSEHPRIFVYVKHSHEKQLSAKIYEIRERIRLLYKHYPTDYRDIKDLKQQVRQDYIDEFVIPSLNKLRGL